MSKAGNEIITVIHEDNFLDPVTLIRELHLSFGAVGLIQHLCTYSDDEEITADELATHTPDGLKVVQSLLRELEAAGFVQINPA